MFEKSACLALGWKKVSKQTCIRNIVRLVGLNICASSSRIRFFFFARMLRGFLGTGRVILNQDCDFKMSDKKMSKEPLVRVQLCLLMFMS